MTTKVKDLPHNTEAEKAVLGAMLRNKLVLSDVLGALEVNDFFEENENHRAIFNAMLRLNQRNLPVDAQTVTDELINAKELEVSGGPEYLLELADSVITFSNIKSYIDIVKDHSILRSFIVTMNDIEDKYHNNDIANISDFLRESERKLTAITDKRRIAEFKKAKEVTDALAVEFENLKATTSNDTVTGVPTGFPKMNMLTHGFHKDEFIVIAARPGVGKTALSLNLALTAAQYGFPVAYFSLEMPASMLFKRLVSSDSNVPFDDLITGYGLNQNVRLKLQQSCARLATTKIYVDDTSGIKLLDLVAKAKKLANKEALGMIIVDYIGLVHAQSGNKNENRQLEIQTISQTLKNLAMELHIPVIGVAQLNRNVESRPGGEPMLSDLRESGSLEQDADIVMMIHEHKLTDESSGKPSIFEKQDKAVNEAQQQIIKKEGGQDTKLVTVAIVKNRSGRTGNVELLFRKNYCKFDSPSKEADEQIAALEKERINYFKEN